MRGTRGTNFTSGLLHTAVLCKNEKKEDKKGSIRPNIYVETTLSFINDFKPHL
jgi:hypothetical protein